MIKDAECEMDYVGIRSFTEGKWYVHLRFLINN